MIKRVLLFQGGWDGHQPDKSAQLFADQLSVHDPQEFTDFPHALTLTVNGLRWAADAL